MNKKVAIITWTRGVNYGTILQAYSTCSTLQKHGFDAVLLDDSTVTEEFKAACAQNGHNEKVQHSAHSVPNRLTYYINKFKKAAVVLSSPKKYRAYKNQRTFERASSNKKQAFIKFKSEYLKLSPPFSMSDYNKIGNEYDAFVCGSDQIWTVRSKPEYFYYYLGFTDPSKLRIAYAPCIGDNDIPDFARADIVKLVKRFDFVAMRDDHGARLISSALGRTVPTVLDPVLLKTSEEWKNELSLEKTNEKYLLCYILGTHKWYDSYITALSKELGLPLRWIPVNPEQAEFLDGDVSPCGPKEFVELLCNAEYVCTDSYHATLFSILFGKQFTVLERYSNDENSQNERFYSLFKMLGINKTIISEKMFGKSDTYELEYDIIRSNLTEKRRKSLDYLLTSLNDYRS